MCRQKEVFRNLNPKLSTLPLGSNAKNVSLSFPGFLFDIYISVAFIARWKWVGPGSVSSPLVLVFIYVFGIYSRVGFM